MASWMNGTFESASKASNLCRAISALYGDEYKVGRQRPAFVHR